MCLFTRIKSFSNCNWWQIIFVDGVICINVRTYASFTIILKTMFMICFPDKIRMLLSHFSCIWQRIEEIGSIADQNSLLYLFRHSAYNSEISSLRTPFVFLFFSFYKIKCVSTTWIGRIARERLIRCRLSVIILIRWYQI